MRQNASFISTRPSRVRSHVMRDICDIFRLICAIVSEGGRLQVDYTLKDLCFIVTQISDLIGKTLTCGIEEDIHS